MTSCLSSEDTFEAFNNGSIRLLDRVRSSRRLAKNARGNVVYMYLSEELSSDFRTVSDFRKNDPEFVKEVFTHIVSFGREEGLIDLSHLSTDGSKIKANASNERVFTREELEVLLKFADVEFEEWLKQDVIEDKDFGDLSGRGQLLQQSKGTIQKAVKYYIKKIKERGINFKEELKERLKDARDEADEQDLKEVSISDFGSCFMKNKKGKIELSYNPQLIVDRKGFIVANEVCQDANDVRQLKPQVLQAEEKLDKQLEDVAWSFDSGYFGGNNIKFLLDKKVDGYIPDNNEKQGNNPYDKKHFIYDPIGDEYACSEGNKVVFVGESFDKQKEKSVRVYKGGGCLSCQSRSKCTKRRDGIRYFKMLPYEGERNIMIAKMKTEEAKEIYKIRWQTVELVFGDIKENKGFRTFHMRGIEGVRTEFNIVCAATNIKRIWEHLQNKKRGVMDTIGQFIQKLSYSLNYLFCKDSLLGGI